MRWMPHKPRSAEAIAGKKGRWQVLLREGEPNAHWVRARKPPGEWHGANLAPRATRFAEPASTPQSEAEMAGIVVGPEGLEPPTRPL
jgi:hypothetical protein